MTSSRQYRKQNGRSFDKTRQALLKRARIGGDRQRFQPEVLDPLPARIPPRGRNSRQLTNIELE